MDWAEFTLAFAAFLLSHALPVRPPLRPWLVSRLGSAGFGLAYSALSLGILAWLIGAAGRAPHVPLWTWAPWQNGVVLAVMLPVCLILTLAIGRPNPFSFGGWRNDRFDPARPGIIGWMRHPLLVALSLWAAAHLLPNGDLAHVILFGSFAAFAMLGGRMIDRRRARETGPERYRCDTDVVPMADRAAFWPEPALRVALGLILYAGLIWLHPVLIGVNPLP